MAVDPDRVIELKLDSRFQAFLQAAWKQHPHNVEGLLDQQVLALDPGETTGVAEYFGKDRTIRVYQKVTKELGPSGDWLKDILLGRAGEPSFFDPDVLRYEDYRIYGFKAEDHSWSPVHTIRWIGCIEYVAHYCGTPASCVMAVHAKGFWTDEKLNMFGLNPKGLKHGRDALRHLLYYLCFPTKKHP